MFKIRYARLKVQQLLAKFAERSHIVQSGDTLSEMAGTYYGDWQLWPLIWSANGRPSPENLPIGTTMSIPPKRALNSEEKKALKEDAQRWQGNVEGGRSKEYQHSPETEQYQVNKNMSKDVALAKMFAYARQWKGTPYGWGGAGKGQWNLEIPTEQDKSKWQSRLQGRSRKVPDPSTGIDCSGFLQKVLAIGGVVIPHDMTAASMYGYLSSKGKKITSPEPGAIIFFVGQKGISHAGIIAENGNILEARSGAGVTDNLDPTARANMRKIYLMPNYPFLQKEPLV